MLIHTLCYDCHRSYFHNGCWLQSSLHVHICGSMCLRKKSPSFGLLSTSADQIFLLNAFQTFVGKATGKIKPTKSYSDYYVFLCSF